MKSASDLLIATIRHIVVALGCLFVSPLPLPGQGVLGAESGKDESVRSLGVYVTLVRLSQVTESGLMAIPQGALVSVVESAGGQKYAVFRQARVMIADLSMVSNDPSRIAAATAGAAKGGGNLTPGSVIGSGGENGPQARAQRQILVDDDGNVIAKSMTTTIDDGAGNTTTIEQGNARGMTPERAGKLAAAQQGHCEWL